MEGSLLSLSQTYDANTSKHYHKYLSLIPLQQSSQKLVRFVLAAEIRPDNTSERYAKYYDHYLHSILW